jgi:activator of HSP90 ATPase
LALKFRIIKQTVLISATPGDVYDALLNARKHSEFTGSPATANAKTGSTFRAWDGYIEGKNLELVKGKKIVQEWRTTGWPADYPPSRLELTLTAKKDATELRMVHSKVPAEQADAYAQGWYDSYWDPLKEYFGRKKKASG